MNNFLLTPLHTANATAFIFVGNQFLGKERTMNIFLEKRRADEKVPEEVAEPISAFIKDILKSDGASIDLIVTDSSTSSCEAAGTLKKGAIFFSRKFIEEIRQDFNRKHRFAIAHELGHLVAADSISNYNDSYLQMRLMVMAYGVSVLACTYFLGLKGVVVGHVVGCFAMKAVEYTLFYLHASKRRQQERKADEFAANIASELILGGYDYFDEMMAENQRLREAIKLTLIMGKLIVQINTGKVFKSPEGDERFDFNHPKLSERRKAMQLLLQN